MEPKNGKFIVVEGISGSGKVTQARRIAQHLQSLDEYASILITPEPTGSESGQKMRTLMKQHRDQKENPENHARTYFDYFLQDRIEHQELINYNLIHGVHVIGVRYYHSSIVHQQNLSLSAEEIVKKHLEAAIRKPDLTIILDLNPERAFARLTDRDEKGVYETTSRLRISRELYLKLPEFLSEERIMLVNSLGSVEAVFEYYQQAVENVIGYEGKKKS